MDKLLLILFLLGGLFVLISYIYIFGYMEPGAYLTHPFWLTLPRRIVILFTVFQIFAAVGFCIGTIHWIANTPTTGVFGNHPWLLPLTLGIFLIGSSIWAPATYFNHRVVSVGSLIVVAVASILLPALIEFIVLCKLV